MGKNGSTTILGYQSRNVIDALTLQSNRCAVVRILGKIL